MTPKSEQQKKKLKVILDSNALFVPLQFKIDIFEELKTLLGVRFELVLPLSILKELHGISEKGSPKMQKWAAYALELAKRCEVVQFEEEKEGSPDDAIVNMASKWNCPVFTNDRALRKRLRDISAPVIYVRQKSRLEINGRIKSSV